MSARASVVGTLGIACFHQGHVCVALGHAKGIGDVHDNCNSDDDDDDDDDICS